ncbi:MAG: hypothetical protein ACYTBJ_20820 [Planctomycetota bacterium]|jgi:hypothetical protein
MDMKSHLVCYGLTYVLLLAPRTACAGQGDVDAKLKLPAEMLRIIEGSQATLDSVRNMEATINVVSKTSFGTLGSRELVQTEKIWYDGSHVRKDLLESKFVGKETEPLFVEQTSNGSKGYIESPSPGSVEISSVESFLYYVPKTKNVFIVQPEWDDRKANKMNTMLMYQSIRGITLAELIVESAKKGYSWTPKRDILDGDDCILLTCDYPVGPETPPRIWVVPSKGYCIKKVQEMYNGKVFNEYTTTLKEYAPDIWWFDSVHAESHMPWQRATDVISELTVNSFKFKDAIDPKAFTIAGTDIPYGTKVFDRVTGLNYVYGRGFEMPQEDIDLALEALENAKIAPREHATATPPNTLPTEPTQSITDEQQNHRGSRGPERVNLGQSDVSEKAQGKWLPVLLVGLALVILAGLALLKGKKVCAK